MKTQSQNSSAKLAIITQKSTLEIYYISYGDNGKWHVIPDYTLQVSQTGFVFSSNNFLLKPFDEITQRLTSTGVMNHIVRKCFDNHRNVDEKNKWSVLTTQSLSFGFTIWLGCCGACIVVFIGEI